jgi:CRP/FNR family transcriptional regulator, cyclic AMP receptor protein
VSDDELSTRDVRIRLAACSLFRGIDAEHEAFSDLAESCDIQRARKGEPIIVEGSEGDQMYVVLSGRVAVRKRTPAQDTFTVSFGEEGDFFGELSLLDRAVRSATVIAESDTQLLAIHRERFVAFGDRCPAAGLLVTRRVAERLAKRLRHASEDVVTLFSALVDEVEQRL